MADFARCKTRPLLVTMLIGNTNSSTSHLV